MEELLLQFLPLLCPGTLVSGQGLVTVANTEWQVLTMLDFMVQLLELKIQVNR